MIPVEVDDRIRHALACFARRGRAPFDFQVRAWRAGLQDIFCNLSQHPEAADFADFRSRLDAMVERLEEQIEEAIAGEDQASTSTRENENSIRLLGAFRGVSEELVNFARQSGGIDWARLREARF